jgi:hypothetical protein
MSAASDVKANQPPDTGVRMGVAAVDDSGVVTVTVNGVVVNCGFIDPHSYVEGDPVMLVRYKKSWIAMGTVVAAGSAPVGQVMTSWVQGICTGLTLTTSETPVPGMSVTLTNTVAGATYDVDVSCDVNITVAGSGNADIRLYVDGALIPERIFSGLTSSVGRMTGAKNFIGTLTTTGDHTFEVRALKGAAPTITIQSTHSTINAKLFE